MIEYAQNPLRLICLDLIHHGSRKLIASQNVHGKREADSQNYGSNETCNPRHASQNEPREANVEHNPMIEGGAAYYAAMSGKSVDSPCEEAEG